MAHHHENKNHKCRKHKSKQCQKKITISRKDFCKNGTYSKTYKISKSGNYSLVNNIRFNPNSKNTTAILIDADNVMLDLCGYVIEQKNENILTGITGIKIAGRECVTIVNGKIRNFSQRGVYIQGGSKYPELRDVIISGNGNGTSLAHSEDRNIFDKGDGVLIIPSDPTYNPIVNPDDPIDLTQVQTYYPSGIVKVGEQLEVDSYYTNADTDVWAFWADTDPSTWTPNNALFQTQNRRSVNVPSFIGNVEMNVVRTTRSGEVVLVIFNASGNARTWTIYTQSYFSQSQGGVILGETTKSYEIYGFDKPNGKILDATFNNVKIDDNYGYGLFIGNINGFDFLKSSISRTINEKIAGIPYFFSPSGSRFVSFEVHYQGDIRDGDEMSNVRFIDSKFNGNISRDNGKDVLLPATTPNIQHDIFLLVLLNQNFDMIDCEITQNKTISTFVPTSSSNKVVSAASLRGFVCGAGECNSFINVNFCSNLAEAGYSSGIQGFHQSGFSVIQDNLIKASGWLMKNCSSSNNISRTTNVEGFTFNTSIGFFIAYVQGGEMINCSANNNHAIPAVSTANSFTRSYGIEINGINTFDDDGLTTNFIIDKCHVSGNRGFNDLGTAENYGFFINSSGDDSSESIINITVKECEIDGNTDGIFANIRSIGILLQGFMKDITIENCIIKDHSFFGILIVENNGVCHDSQIIDNLIVNNGDGGGILISRSSLDVPMCCSVMKNTIQNCGAGAYIDLIDGDPTIPTTNLVAENKGFNNGNFFGFNDGWAGSYAFGPIPVKVGSLTTGYPTGVEACDNIEIQKDAIQSVLKLSIEEVQQRAVDLQWNTRTKIPYDVSCICEPYFK